MDLPTQTHLAALRELLSFRSKELSAEIHAAEVARRDSDAHDTHEVADRKDEAAEEASSDIAAAQLLRDVQELKRVEAALHRLDQGVYGDCLDCGEPIPMQRLFVQPAAERCAACQAAAERTAAR
jgi:RNA polymerase-binding protein DksA